MSDKVTLQPTDTEIGERVMSIVRLPDGRWAARNERDVADVTRDDLLGITEAFKLWGKLLWDRRPQYE